MAKQRQHNEYFRTVECGGRKSCPSCKERLAAGESIWSWGNYIRGKWYTVTHFCARCFVARVKSHLAEHVGGCGCQVNMVGYSGTRLPSWLSLGGEQDHG